MNEFYILDGQKVIATDRSTWQNWWSSYSRNSYGVAMNRIRDIGIATLFLKNASDHDPPVLFETAVFSEDGTKVCARYTNWDDAIVGHDFWVNHYLHISEMEG